MKNVPGHKIWSWLITVLVVCAVAPIALAQGTTRYVYDNNGRLRAVIAPSGEAAIYDYDPAGNFTAIRRLTANDLEIIEFTPREGAIGTEVTIFGVGFNGNVSNVSFNGATAQIISQTPTSVVVTVPAAATTGTISLTSPRGTRTSNDVFTVKGIGVYPNLATVAAGRSLQFMALVSGLLDSSVVWSVGGVVGGNNTVGMITAGGFYVAPNVTTTTSSQYVIRATSTFEPTIFGEATITVPGVGGGYDAISGGVSVRYGTPLPPTVVPSFATGAVSVRYGTPVPPTSVPVFTTTAISVRYGTPTPPTSVPSFVTNAVSARYGAPALAAPRDDVPSISAIAPVTLPNGKTVSMTLTGANLTGASDIQFFSEDGTLDSTIRVSDIQVNAEGSSLTAQIHINAKAKAAGRIVQVITPTGISTKNNLGTNKLQIVP